MDMERRSRARPGKDRRKPKASTEEILQPNLAARPVPSKWRRHHHRLLQLHEEMLRRLSQLAADALQEHPAFSTHMADAGTDTFDRDFALSMLSMDQDAVYQIEQAIDRIHSGTYGVCELTGKPIEPQRLEAIPWTRFSASAERQLENEGERTSPRLGRRESVGRSHTSSRLEET